MSEHTLQVKVLDHIALRRRADVFAFAIPNAARRSLREGAKMKAEGLVAGAPDLCVMLPNKVAWLELKTPKGRQSLAQKGFQARCERLGHRYGLVRSLDEAIVFLADCGALKGYM
ncbi:MAG: VRR-NUC domain-containing protein [Tardiphaga sp.]